MGILSKLMNKISGTEKEESAPVVEDDSKLFTEVLYNTYENFIVLISYSLDYVASVVEFLSACQSSGLVFITMQTSYDDESEEELTDDEEEYEIKPKEIAAYTPEEVTHQRQYIILSGNMYNYSCLFSEIDNLSNDILLALQKEFYAYCASTSFEQHIVSGIMNIENFEYKKIAPTYDKEICVNSHNGSVYYISDIDNIINKIPKGFCVRDILQILRYRTSDTETGGTLLKLLKTMYKNNKCFKSLEKYYKVLTGPLTIDRIESIISCPKYAFTEEDILDSGMNGKELDEIFNQKYERFSGIAADDISFTDIDEVIPNDGEEGSHDDE